MQSKTTLHQSSRQMKYLNDIALAEKPAKLSWFQQISATELWMSDGGPALIYLIINISPEKSDYSRQCSPRKLLSWFDLFKKGINLFKNEVMMRQVEESIAPFVEAWYVAN